MTIRFRLYRSSAAGLRYSPQIVNRRPHRRNRDRGKAKPSIPAHQRNCSRAPSRQRAILGPPVSAERQAESSAGLIAVGSPPPIIPARNGAGVLVLQGSNIEAIAVGGEPEYLSQWRSRPRRISQRIVRNVRRTDFLLTSLRRGCGGGFGFGRVAVIDMERLPVGDSAVRTGRDTHP